VTSGARLPKFEPTALDAEQRSLYDAIAGGRRAQGPQLFRLADADGRLEGPFNAFLLQPRLGSALQALGASVRYDTGLDDRCRAGLVSHGRAARQPSYLKSVMKLLVPVKSALQ